MNQPDDTTNEVASDYVADTPITSDLLEELKRPSDGDRKDLITLCREFERELAEKTNDVARLRELLDGALLALERAIKNIPKESTVVPYEDALWKIRKQLKQITKCNQ